jgi:hypothetical protein
MHWIDSLTHSSIRIYVIGAFFIILTWFAYVFRVENPVKDALFAMYA